MAQRRGHRSAVRAALGENRGTVVQLAVAEAERTFVEAQRRDEDLLEATNLNPPVREIDARDVALLAVSTGEHAAALADGHELRGCALAEEAARQ